MIKPNFEKPVSLGTDFVDKSVFPNLRDVLAKSIGASTHDFTEWPYYDQEKDSMFMYRKKLLRVLADVTDSLCTYASDGYGHSASSIYYEIHTHDVAPGRTQSFYNGDYGKWHIDFRSRSTAALFVSDSLPTEFLLPSDRTGWRVNRIRKHLSEPRETNDLDYKDSEIAYALKKGAFTVYRPNPYEAVVADDHVHQSPTNTTDETIPRVWFRASMVLPKDEE